MANSPGPASVDAPARVILRRRSGDVVHRVTHGEKGTSRHFMLGSDAVEATPRARLMMACENIAETLRSGNDAIVSMKRLFPEQETVFEDVVKYFQYCADHAASGATVRADAGRIEMPPGCGKTVVIGKIIAASGATAVIVTPLTTLAEQMERDLREQLPGAKVGIYTGDRKELVDGGIVITTNAMMYGWMRNGDAPKQVREATVAFFDEGHRLLTALAHKVLNGVCDINIIRIGLSGSPHYDELKTMALVFPYLIHRIDFEEALALKLISKPRCGVYEVDVDGSEVRVVKGIYDPKTLERIERQAPFFQAALDLRYAPENIGDKALIVCRTRQQCYDLQRFMATHRPAGTPMPAYIVSGMDDDQRRKNLHDFESGKIDTLINVRVLTLGWNHPPCKVMVDLTFGLSLVDAIQKWLRITRLWKREGTDEYVVPRLYILLPKGLERMPVLPSDLFGMDVETDPEQFIELQVNKVIRPAKQAKVLKIERRRRTDVAEVKVTVRKLMDIEMSTPTLDRNDDRQIREVLLSQVAFKGDSVPARTVFRELTFVHPLFTGSGTQLLRYLRIADPVKYATTMVRLFPFGASSYLVRAASASMGDEEYARKMMRRHALKAPPAYLRKAAEQAAEHEWGCDIDLAILEAETHRQLYGLRKRRRVSKDVAEAWWAFGVRDPIATPEEEVHQLQVYDRIHDELDGVTTEELRLQVRLSELEDAAALVDEKRSELKERIAAATTETERALLYGERDRLWNATWSRDEAIRENNGRKSRRRILSHAFEMTEGDKDVKAYVTDVNGGQLPERYQYNKKYAELLHRAQDWMRDRIRTGMMRGGDRADRYDFSCVYDLFVL
ncbi:MAG: DEAD/DEAH box helicase family protein [Candidatus Uhrbacteria bacterium]|nr:DEAD/DEAH box helicase family protein [Candidatus Uhrbacteria bacterium]